MRRGSLAFLFSLLPSLAAAQEAAPEKPKPARPLEKDAFSYILPGVEIVGFEAGLNLFDRHFVDDEAYGVTRSSIADNLHHSWEYDNDPFSTNQFMHPYGGSIYFGFARSAGLNYWESLGYTAFGSLLWEYAGETEPPSINDQITTTLGGSFLGEALFRMATLLLKGGGDEPGVWRELGGAILSPPTGFNRLAFGDRFDGLFPDNDPPLFVRMQLGGSVHSHASDSSVESAVPRSVAVGELSVAYGLPGRPGYTYSRPFDYFDFEVDATSKARAPLENVLVRGLVYGAPYDLGEDYRGIWGLYGSYDYISPETFRVSSTALGLGTTGQWWLSREVALQGTILGGVGFGSAGTVPSGEDREYHYGTIPEGLLALRFIFSDVAMLDLTAREYYITGTGIDQTHGSENFARVQGAFMVRVWGNHALGIQYEASQRDGFDAAERRQTVGTLSLVYAFLGDRRFGAVEWRNLDRKN